ncbi:2-(3-amino-3-carboxypropyl)histidine synthase subunit 2-like [Oratosquilla oratoria]|uniref:2-(3-amino-3-carboxypropyl)histidine synthase subunit 2-like n=1 Tax=Oratosquilla oratoria TaxID=337810 RepID=UPI003F75EBB3
MTSAFSSPETAVLEQELQNISGRDESFSFEDQFEIERSVLWIKNGLYQKVGLQFPDELLCDAPPVARELEKRLKQKVYILGDTTYGSCCVDEVTAEHVGADSIIHYGRSCLSPSKQLPVLHVFTRIFVNMETVINGLTAILEDKETKLILTYDTRCSYAADLLFKQLQEEFPNILNSTLLVSVGIAQSEENKSQEDTVKEKHTKVEQFFGRQVVLPSESDIKDYHFIYLGPSTSTLTCLATKFSESTFYHVIPENGEVSMTSGLKSVMVRSGKIEKIRDAAIIGILVGTLGVSDYRSIIRRLKDVIKAAEKKSYIFAVGKPNEPKIANIPEVDIYVYVACPETSLMDRNTDPYLYQKLVTPWEVEVALNASQEWSVSLESDFRQLLNGGSCYKELQPVEEEVSVSLITNKAQRLGVRNVPEAVDAITSAVVISDGAGPLASIHVGGGGQLLQERSWKGLDPDLVTDTVVGAIVEGRKGIASVYQDEV